MVVVKTGLLITFSYLAYSLSFFVVNNFIMITSSRCYERYDCLLFIQLSLAVVGMMMIWEEEEEEEEEIAERDAGRKQVSENERKKERNEDNYISNLCTIFF